MPPFGHPSPNTSTSELEAVLALCISSATCRRRAERPHVSPPASNPHEREVAKVVDGDDGWLGGREMVLQELAFAGAAATIETMGESAN